MGQLLVIGVSTSEVLGHRIGTAGAVETAAQIYAGVEAVRSEVGFIPVFQCCEHLNRALVMERACRGTLWAGDCRCCSCAKSWRVYGGLCLPAIKAALLGRNSSSACGYRYW